MDNCHSLLDVSMPTQAAHRLHPTAATPDAGAQHQPLVDPGRSRDTPVCLRPSCTCLVLRAPPSCPVQCPAGSAQQPPSTHHAAAQHPPCTRSRHTLVVFSQPVCTVSRGFTAVHALRWSGTSRHQAEPGCHLKPYPWTTHSNVTCGQSKNCTTTWSLKHLVSERLGVTVTLLQSQCGVLA